MYCPLTVGLEFVFIFLDGPRPPQRSKSCPSDRKTHEECLVKEVLQRRTLTVYTRQVCKREAVRVLVGKTCVTKHSSEKLILEIIKAHVINTLGLYI